MNLADVMDEIGAALAVVTGLTVHVYPVGALTPPAGYLSYPLSIDYDQEYANGAVQFTDFPIVLVAGKANDKAARDKVAGYAAGSGMSSVKRALEGRNWVACDDVSITSASFDLEMIGGIPYLAVMFKATIVGPGTE